MATPSRRRAILTLALGACGLCSVSGCAAGKAAASDVAPAPPPAATVVTVSSQPQPTTPPRAPQVLPTPTRSPERPEGRLLFEHEGNIWLWSPDGMRQVTTGGTDTQAAWSPDGARIAYASSGPGWSDILVLDVDSGQVRRLTQNRSARPQNGSWAFRPAWSPDGRQIAYISDAATYHPALWLVNADGSGRRQLTAFADGRGGVDMPTWTPDGQRLLFMSYPTEGPAQIFAIDIATARLTQLTTWDAMVYDPAISPDGRLLAFVTLDENGNRIWTTPVDGGEATFAVAGNRNRAPSWSPDGNWLAFIGANGGNDYGVYATRLESDGTFGTPLLLSDNLSVRPGGGLSWGV